MNLIHVNSQTIEIYVNVVTCINRKSSLSNYHLGLFFHYHYGVSKNNLCIHDKHCTNFVSKQSV